MVLTGLGVGHPPLSLGPRWVQDQPISRLLAPCLMEAQPLNDEALGRALETRADEGVTALYRLMAATAAERLGPTPRVAPLDRPSFPVDGHSHRDTSPDAQVVPSTRGSRREHRPDRKHVMLALRVEPHAGIAVRMQPLSGHSREAPACGQVVQAPMAPLHTTDGPTDLVADRALYRADHLPPLAEPRLPWLTRVPATVRAAPAALAPADPQTMAPRLDGYRSRVLASTSGGVAPRGVLIASEPRLPQAQRTVDTHLFKPRAPAVHAGKKRCRTALACAAAAPQALSTVAHGVQATFLAPPTVRSTPRDGQRGRPGPDPPPAQGVDASEGGLASRVAVRQARVDQHRGGLLALTRWTTPSSRPRSDSRGHRPRAGGTRRSCPPGPTRSGRVAVSQNARAEQALVLVMTGCRLVSAALASRLRQALQDPG
jgi:hypothetical protein